MKMGVCGENSVDVLDIVEGIIEEETQVGTLAKGRLNGLCQLITTGAGLALDVVEDFLSSFGGEDAEIDTSDAQVGRYSHRAHRYEHITHAGGLAAKYLAQFFLK